MVTIYKKVSFVKQLLIQL